MGTPLMWKACTISDSYYHKFLRYPHLIRLDGNLEMFEFETRPRKLVPFYIAITFIALNDVGCLVLVPKYVVRPGSISIHIAVLYAAAFAFITMLLGVLYVANTDGHELCIEYFNTLIKYQGKLFDRKQKEKYAAQKDLALTRLVIIEVWKVIRGDPSADYMGILILGLNLFLMVIGTFIGTAAFLFHLDPVTIFLKEYIGWKATISTFLIRYIIIVWSSLEVTRTLSIPLTPAMAIFNITKNILIRIKNQPLSIKTLSVYTELQVITEVGREGIRNLAGLLMASGFLIAVSCNCITLKGWEFLPEIIYGCIVLVNVIVYLVIMQTIPKIIDCHENSKKMILHLWPERLMLKRNKESAFISKILRKTLISKRPIAYRYGLAVFDYETKTNYYENIVESTIDTLMLM